MRPSIRSDSKMVEEPESDESEPADPSEAEEDLAPEGGPFESSNGEEWRGRFRDRCAWGELVAVLFLSFFPPLVGALHVLIDSQSERSSAGRDIMFLFASLQVSIPLLWILSRDSGGLPHFGVFRFQPRRDFGWVLFLFLVGTVGLMASSYLLSDTPPGDQVTDVDHWDAPLIHWWRWLIWVPMLTAAALWEELAMRAYLLTRFSDWGMGRIAAVLISSALFASYHVYQGWFALPIVFGFGLFYGFMFLRIGRVAPLVVAHTLTNLALTAWAVTRYS